MDKETTILDDIPSTQTVNVNYDLQTNSDVIIEANSTKMISTNIYFKLSSNFDGYMVSDPQLVMESNEEFDVPTMLKIFDKVPMIVCLINKNEFDIKLNKGERIASIFIEKEISDTSITS
jgi:dUTPase